MTAHTKKIIAIFFLFVIKIPAFAQEKNSCEENFAIYNEFLKINFIDDAFPFWKHMFENCPDFSDKIYKDGIKLLKKKYHTTSNPQEKQFLFSYIVKLHNIESKKHPENYKIPAALAMDYVKLQKTDSAILVALAILSEKVMNADTIIDWRIYKNYLLINKLLYEKQLLSNPQKEQATYLIFHNYFWHCELGNEKKKELFSDIIKTYKNKNINFNTALDSLVSQIYTFKKFNCLKSFFYFLEKQQYKNTKLVNQISKIQTLDSIQIKYFESYAFYLAGKYNKGLLSISNTNIEKLDNQYLKKEELYFLKSKILSELNKMEDALKYINAAIEADKSRLDLYLLKAKFYANSSTLFTDNFAKKAIYQLAVNKLTEAKSNLNTSDQLKLEKVILYYKQFTPTKEDIFMQTLENNSFYLGYWIKETITF